MPFRLTKPALNAPPAYRLLILPCLRGMGTMRSMVVGAIHTPRPIRPLRHVAIAPRHLPRYAREDDLIISTQS